MKWEYFTFTKIFDDDDALDKILNERGLHEWELVSVIKYDEAFVTVDDQVKHRINLLKFFMKRPIEDKCDPIPTEVQLAT